MVQSFTSEEMELMRANKLSSVFRETKNTRLAVHSVLNHYDPCQLAGALIVYTGDCLPAIQRLRKMSSSIPEVFAEIRQLFSVAAQHDVHLDFIWEPRETASMVGGSVWGKPTLDCFAGGAVGQHKADKYYTPFHMVHSVGVDAVVQVLGEALPEGAAGHACFLESALVALQGSDQEAGDGLPFCSIGLHSQSVHWVVGCTGIIRASPDVLLSGLVLMVSLDGITVKTDTGQIHGQTNQNSSSQDRDSDIDHTPGTGEASPSREVAPEEVYSSPPPPPPVKVTKVSGAAENLSTYTVASFPPDVKNQQLVATLTTNIEKLSGSPVTVTVDSVTSGLVTVQIATTLAFLSRDSSSASTYMSALTGGTEASNFETSFGSGAVGDSFIKASTVASPSES
ncbi:MAG: hypothetical protein FRX49_12114 [Trebouxia sp. A1-2]|nr:MAG: hypothetical protein FRX49_12114 [Trebouxia sp. A1-2]